MRVLPDYSDKATRFEWEQLTNAGLEEYARAESGVGKYIRNWFQCWKPEQIIPTSDIQLRFEGDMWLLPKKPVQWDYEDAKSQRETSMPGWGRALVLAPHYKIHSGEPRLGWDRSFRYQSFKYLLEAVSKGKRLAIPHGHDAVDARSNIIPSITFFKGTPSEVTGEWIIGITDGHHRWELATALGEHEIPIILLLNEEEVIKYSKGKVPWTVLHLSSMTKI